MTTILTTTAVLLALTSRAAEAAERPFGAFATGRPDQPGFRQGQRFSQDGWTNLGKARQQALAFRARAAEVAADPARQIAAPGKLAISDRRREGVIIKVDHSRKYGNKALIEVYDEYCNHGETDSKIWVFEHDCVFPSREEDNYELDPEFDLEDIPEGSTLSTNVFHRQDIIEFEVGPGTTSVGSVRGINAVRTGRLALPRIAGSAPSRNTSSSRSGTANSQSGSRRSTASSASSDAGSSERRSRADSRADQDDNWRRR